MLDKIRNGVAHNKLVRASLVVITIAFVFWGMGISSLSFTKNYAVKVGSVEISANDYHRAYQQSKQQIVAQFGGQEVSAEILKLLGIEKQVTEQFVSQAILESYANSENLFIDEKTIFELIKQEPAFRNEGGEFDKEVYKAALRQVQLTPVEFEKSIVKRVQANLIATMMDNSVEVSDYELEMKVKEVQERRDIDILTVTATDIAKLPTATDDELNSLYEENADNFKIEEKRSFKLLVISKNTLAKEQSVTDEEVQQYFDEHKDEFFTKPEFKVQQILVKDQTTADKVLALTDLSENFAKYVAEYSTDESSKQNTGDMGWLTADIFGAEFENAMQSTAKGAVANNAVKTVFGYHVIKVADIKEAKAKEFAEVKEQIKANLISNKADEALDDTINNTLDMVSAGEKLDTIAKQLNFELQEFNDITANEPQKYTKVVFETELGEVSQDIDMGLNTIAFAQVTNIKEASIKPFAEVKSSLEAQFKETKTAEMLQAKADEILKAITENSLSFKNAAKQFNLTAPIKSVVAVNRNGSEKKGVNAQTAYEVFTAQTNTLIEKTLNDKANIIIIKVLDSYQEAIADEQKEQLRMALSAEKTNDLFNAFKQNAKHTNKIKVNQQVIDYVVKQ